MQLKPKNYYSITRLVKSFFSEFNADKVIDKMMSSANWKTSKYFGMSCDEIKKQWNESGKEAAELGTKMHSNIELELTKEKIWNDDTKECIYFHNFMREHPHFHAFQLELLIDLVDKHLEDYKVKEFMLRGIIDACFLNEQNNIVIVDWKRAKEIKMTNTFESGKRPLTRLQDCNYNHYSLQLNFYRFMMERYEGYKIDEMMIVNLNPEGDNYQKFVVRDMQTDVHRIMKLLASQCE